MTLFIQKLKMGSNGGKTISIQLTLSERKGTGKEEQSITYRDIHSNGSVEITMIAPVSKTDGQEAPDPGILLVLLY